MSRAVRDLESSHRDDVVIVGLGTVAETHLKVLSGIPGVRVMAGVEPAGPRHLAFRGQDVPVHATVRDAAELYTPTLVIVTTPTATHAKVCREVRGAFPRAEILVEKPAADALSDADELLADSGGGRISVAYHMAFAPEVLWGERLVRARCDDLGPIVSAEAWFTDPYEAEIESARTRFGNSWIDSGSNSLSVLARFCDPVERVSLRAIGEVAGSIYEARIRCISMERDFEALIVTSWHVTAPSRRTRLRFSSGAELVLDHHAVAGYLVEKDRATQIFGTDGSVPRRDSHYAALYHRLLVDRRPLMPAEQSRVLHALLLQQVDP